MSYDFYADLWDEKRKKVDWNKIRKKNIGLTQRMKLTSLYLRKNKEQGKKRLKNIIDNKEWKLENKRKVFLNPNDSVSELCFLTDLMKKLTILERKPTILPEYSTLFKIIFTLKKPFISKDDEEFYIIDNPICKDKVFKVPYIRPSSWKGALRYAAMRLFLDKLSSNKKRAFEERAKLIRLFGNEKDNVEEYLDNIFNEKYQPDNPEKKTSEEFLDYIVKKGYVGKEGNGRGRLIFYPTFFDQIGLDVIAPHDRRTKTVTQRGAIPFETVPENRSGVFSLLYFPFDLVGNDEKSKKEAPEDLEILKEAIPAMLTKYGFGAKTTAGYGVVNEKIKFRILPEIKELMNDGKFGEDGSIFESKMNELIKKWGKEYE